MIKRYSRFFYLLIILCCLLSGNISAQKLYSLAISGGSINFDKSWKFHDGDTMKWANPAYDDKSWKTVELSKWGGEDNHEKFSGNCWFRQRLKVPQALFHKTFLLLVQQTGASEIYLNNKLVQSFGKVGDEHTEVPYDPMNEVKFIELSADSVQLVAVRFSGNKVRQKGYNNVFFSADMVDTDVVDDVLKANNEGLTWAVILFSMFLTISIFHLLLFLYYRKVKTNLYYSILAFLISQFWFYPYAIKLSHDPIMHSNINELSLFLYAPCFFLLIVLLYSIFQHKINWQYWVILGLTILAEIMLPIRWEYFLAVIMTQSIWASIRGIIIVIRAVRAKLPGAWIIASGFLVFLCLILIVLLYVAVSAAVHGHTSVGISGELSQILLFIWAFSVPASMSIYLASDFARTNKKLALQLIHVKQLGEQNILKEREKQQIIEGQKRDLEIKVKEATAEISKQKDELSEKNKEITDSINYARRIQTSILPEDDLLYSSLGEYMVIYKPKDVVSGDFYWCHAMGDKVIFAVADCTGHGVPGAFMSMIGTSLLNEIVIGKQLMEANSILDELRRKIVDTLQQNALHITTRDGMDIALCVWDRKENVLQFAGANNSLYLVSKDIAINGSVKETERVRLSNQHLLEILPDKQPIGYQEDRMDNPFTKSIIQLHKGDTVYIASDGYTDQFGGEKNKKFTSKKFRELIATLVGKPLAEQKHILEHTIEDWKRNEAQTDDICVIGVKV